MTPAKVILLIVALLIGVSITACCLFKNSGDEPSTGQGGGGGSQITNPGESFNIVISGNSNANASKVKDALIEKNFGAQIVFDSDAEQSNEIVVGNTNRHISRVAYIMLEDIIDNVENRAAWIICALDGDLCIAYDSELAFDEAVEYFEREIAAKGTLTFENGTVAQGYFDKIAYVDEKRAEAREAAFAEIVKDKSLSESSINELRSLYGLYGSHTYIFLANLYDPVTGGFYYSNSGRDTVGYAPDLESTWQTLLHLQERGMFVEYNNKMSDALPGEIKNAIVNFTKSLQSEEDGYFYHPQWISVKNSRRSRDLDWATNILAAFGDLPLYDTPNGVAGSTGATGASLIRPLRTSSKAQAASYVVLAAASDAPLSSEASWKAYVDGLPLATDSWSVGNDLHAMASQIKAKGTWYVDYLINHLNAEQNSENGLWENTVTYKSVNGLMKITSTYTDLGRTINYGNEALASAIKIATTEELPEDAGIVYIYNPWVSMQKLVENDPVLGFAKQNTIIENSEQLIRVTAAKLKKFRKDDGGFSYLQNYSASESQGAAVARPYSVESDVNATTISCSTVDIMLEMLGVQEEKLPPIYCAADCKYFVELLLSMGNIIKDSIATGPITFDDYEEGLSILKNGVLLQAFDGRLETNVAYEERAEDGGYKAFRSDIVQNPSPDAAQGDLVLKNNTYKSDATANTDQRFKLDTSAGGNTYVLDMDVFVEWNENTAYDSSTIMQIFLDNSVNSDKTYSLTLSKGIKGGLPCIEIKENYAGANGTKDVLVKGIAVNDWFNLRVECYKTYDDNGALTEIKAKIFINDEYVALSDGGDFKNGAYTDGLIDRARITYNRANIGVFYFNNVVAESKVLDYVEQQLPPKPVVTATFDSFNFTSGNVLYPEDNITNVEHATLNYAITRDPHNAANKVLKVTKTETADSTATLRTVVDLQKNPEGGSLYVFESDVYMSGTTTLEFGLMNSSNKPLSRIRLIAGSDGSIKIRELVSSIGDGDTDIATNVATTDEWFTLGIVFNYIESEENPQIIMTVYINGIAVIENLAAYNADNLASFNVSTFHIRYLAGGKVTAYFDNIVFQKTGEYEYNGGHQTVEGSTDPTITFESFDAASGDLVEQPASNLINNGTGGTAFEVTANPEDENDKVMLVTDPEGTTKSYSQLDLYVVNGDVNRFVFESDIYIDSTGTTDNITECLGIAFTGVDTKLLSKVFVGIENGKVKILESNTVPSDDYVSFGTELADVDNWFKLRLELTFEYGEDNKINQDSLLLKVYVNDIFISEMNTYNDARWSQTNAAGYTVGGVRIGYEKTSALKVYFDDISLVQEAEQVDSTN